MILEEILVNDARWLWGAHANGVLCERNLLPYKAYLFGGAVDR